MSDDKKPNNSDMPKDENKKGDRKRTRSRYEDEVLPPEVVKMLDEQDDRNLLDSLPLYPRLARTIVRPARKKSGRPARKKIGRPARTIGRPARTISSSAAARLQTPNETPGMFVGPQGQLYPKSEWKYVKEQYRNMMLNNPLPPIPVFPRDSSSSSSSSDSRESWSDEDPAFCGYGKMEE